jgi:hypothetical protein
MCIGVITILYLCHERKQLMIYSSRSFRYWGKKDEEPFEQAMASAFLLEALNLPFQAFGVAIRYSECKVFAVRAKLMVSQSSFPLVIYS